jgi:hypothetical protein
MSYWFAKKSKFFVYILAAVLALWLVSTMAGGRRFEGLADPKNKVKTA